MTREKVSYEEYVTDDKGVQKLLERIEDDGSEVFLDKIVRLAAYESQIWTERWTVRMYRVTATILFIAIATYGVSLVSGMINRPSDSVWIAWFVIGAVLIVALLIAAIMVYFWRILTREMNPYSDRFN